jgi:hypothetical protein
MSKLDKLVEIMERAENVCEQFQRDKDSKVDMTLVGISTDTWAALEALQFAVKALDK